MEETRARTRILYGICSGLFLGWGSMGLFSYVVEKFISDPFEHNWFVWMIVSMFFVFPVLFFRVGYKNPKLFEKMFIPALSLGGRIASTANSTPQPLFPSSTYANNVGLDKKISLKLSTKLGWFSATVLLVSFTLFFTRYDFLVPPIFVGGLLIVVFFTLSVSNPNK